MNESKPSSEGRDPGSDTPVESGGRHAASVSDDGFESFLAAVASAPPPYRPPRLGAGDLFAERYRVERPLGSGGMGAVYLARDLELDRSVALKLALGRSSRTELARLQQEARTMAQLSHPGVVTVFEAGEHQTHSFVAMEFVPGGTLRDWMDLGPRPWTEVVDMFVEVARALSAAHDAGVIHRDFKPHNVLIGLSGRPQIADFGLARPAGASGSAGDARSRPVELTATGAVMGTPAYMAPEQRHGHPASAHSDQFSLSVTLFEALHGERPFPGETPEDIASAIQAGPAVSSTSAVPRAVMQIVRRGLREDPEQRHTSVRHLADALQRVRYNRRRRTIQIGAGISLAVAVAIGFISARSVDPPPCDREDIAAGLAATWNTEVSSRIGSNAPADLVPAIDAYTAAFVDARLQACTEHKVDQNLSDEDFALRSACLDRSHSRLVGLLDEMQARPGAYAADVLARVLPPLRDCSDATALRRLGNRHSARSARRSVEADAAYAEAVALLARARAKAWVDDTETDQILARVEELTQRHNLKTILPHVELLHADRIADPAERERRLEAAAESASEAGYVSVLAETSVHMAQAALEQGDIEGAELHLAHAQRLARALGARTAANFDDVASKLVGVEIDMARGRPKPALDTVTPIVATLDPHVRRALEARVLQAGALLDLGRLEASITAYRQALQHPASTEPRMRFGLLLNLGISQFSLGEFDSSQQSFQEAKEAIAGLAGDTAREDAALASNRGVVARLRGQDDEARALQDRAAEIWESLDPSHPNLSYVLDELGELERRSGNFEAAQAALTRSIELRDAAFGPRSAAVPPTLARLAAVFLDQGKPQQAQEVAQLALELLSTHERPDGERTEAEFVVARALRALGRETPASKAAGDAIEHCRTSEHWECTQLIARIVRWQAATPSPAPPPSPPEAEL